MSLMRSKVFQLFWLATFCTSCKSTHLNQENLSEVEKAPNKFEQISKWDIEPLVYSSLPKEGRPELRPWSGYYWASYLGVTSWRWHWKGNLTGYISGTPPKYDLLTEKKVMSLTKEEIAKLSPMEKLDIYRGHYDFYFTRFERDHITGTVFFTSLEEIKDPEKREKKKNFLIRTNAIKATKSSDGKEILSPLKPSRWMGICHGWALAAISEPEPGESATMINQNGQEIVFYRDDIKALLSRAYTLIEPVKKNNAIGLRCRNDSWFAGFRDPACKGVNPAPFHIALGKRIGLDGKSFVLDRSKGYEVWNHPIRYYKFDYGKPRKVYGCSNCAEGTEWTLDVETTVKLANENTPSLTENEDEEITKIYRYRLELDKNQFIIGGEWDANTSSRPDFLWEQNGEAANYGMAPIELVREILAKSLENN